MNRQLFHNAIANEEKLDQSADEISYKDMLDISEALAKANTAEAAERKCIIKTCFRMAGRGSEPGTLGYGGLRWTKTFECATFEAPQPKSSKLKKAVLVAGANRHADVLLDFGDFFALQRGETHFDAEEKCFIFPKLGEKDSSTKVTNYLKGLLPAERGGCAKYAKVALESLPPAPTAAGIRPGACELLAMYVPAEIAVHTTGHDLTGLSALWEYIEAKDALVIVGSLPLAGWPPHPYGQTGPGPVHPTLKALISSGQSDLAKLDPMIDELFAFHDCSPPMLLLGGHMRPMMHAILATMIMYYEQRFKAHEMDQVSAIMRDAYQRVYGSTGDIHSVLCDWGRVIQQRFDSDNLHLTQRQGATDMTQVVTLLQNIHSNSVQQGALLADIHARLTTLETKVHAQSASASSASPPSTSTASGASAPTGLAPTCTDGAPAAAAAPTVKPVTAAPQNVPLQQVGRGLLGGPAETYNTTGVKAARLFLDCMVTYNGDLPSAVARDSRRKSDCLKILNAYKYMMTEKEDALLNCSPPSDRMTINAIINSITVRLVQIIKDEYTKRGIKAPKRLGKGDIYINTMADNLRGCKLIIDRQAFAVWRKGKEGGSSSQAGGSSSKDGAGNPDESDSSKTDQSDCDDEPQPRSTPRKRAPPAKEDSEGSGSDGLEGSDYMEDGSDDGSPKKKKLRRMGSTPDKPVEVE